jgi:multiple sugar transport system permease protein
VGRQGSRARGTLLALGFLAPWLVGFTLFIAYPLGASFYYSLTDFHILRGPRFVGLDNYRDLWQDELFWISLGNTLSYLAFAVPLGTVASVGLAMLVNVRLPGIALFRTLYYTPSIVPVVASALVWLMLLNPRFGLVNTLLRLAGLPAPGWLADPAWAMPAFVLMSLWGVGGSMVIHLAALQAVPADLLDAARLDGAGPWQRTRHVTLPLISPAILFTVVVGVIQAFQYFTPPFVLTDGGPNNATLVYALYLYRVAFQFVKFGYASALAWLLFLLTLGCTLLILRTSTRFVYYGGR